MPNNPWLVCNQSKPGAQTRLFCFPYAGAGASAFFSWGRSLLSTQVEVHSVQLPGRETRLRETPVGSASELVPALTHALLPFLDRPSLFVGHSMGSLVAFEVCRELRRRNARLPERLIVCGSKPPHLVHLNRKLHHLGDAEFIETIVRDYNGIPRELLNEPEILDLVRPILRADFRLMETYSHQEEQPLQIPISAFGGVGDTTVPLANLREWGRHTSREFRTREFAGTHFFINEVRDQVIRAVLDESKAGA